MPRLAGLALVAIHGLFLFLTVFFLSAPWVFNRVGHHAVMHTGGRLPPKVREAIDRVRHRRHRKGDHDCPMSPVVDFSTPLLASDCRYYSIFTSECSLISFCVRFF